MNADRSTSKHRAHTCHMQREQVTKSSKICLHFYIFYAPFVKTSPKALHAASLVPSCRLRSGIAPHDGAAQIRACVFKHESQQCRTYAAPLKSRIACEFSEAGCSRLAIHIANGCIRLLRIIRDGKILDEQRDDCHRTRLC